MDGRRTGRRAFSVVVAIGTLSASLWLGLLLGSAQATHYHVTGNYGGSGHALVHGDSTGDQIWHGRTTPAQVTGNHYCGAGDAGRGLVIADQNNSLGNCTATLRADQFIYNSRECKSFGYANYPNAAIGEHTHGSHVGCTTPA